MLLKVDITKIMLQFVHGFQSVSLKLLNSLDICICKIVRICPNMYMDTFFY